MRGWIRPFSEQKNQQPRFLSARRRGWQSSATNSAARATGQAVATAHVPTHSMGTAVYALQAVHRVTSAAEGDTAVTQERDWQYQQLLELRETSPR